MENEKALLEGDCENEASKRTSIFVGEFLTFQVSYEETKVLVDEQGRVVVAR